LLFFYLKIHKRLTVNEIVKRFFVKKGKNTEGYKNPTRRPPNATLLKKGQIEKKNQPNNTSCPMARRTFYARLIFAS
jgi:hypothetical protein